MMNSRLSISDFIDFRIFCDGIVRVLVIMVMGVVIMSCAGDRHDYHHGEAAVVTYTCPMHPNVITNEAGQCPVCGMDLVPSGNVSSGSSGDLMLTDSQIRLANISIQKVSMQPVGQTIFVNGRLAINAELSEVISSRISGRIDKLFVKEAGRVIRKGEPLYQLYSETLLTLQREFLLAKEQSDRLGRSGDRYEAFLEASRQKLLLYGLTEGQIDQLARNGNVKPEITFLAPVSGVISELNVTEGQYVGEGNPLVRIDNLSKLWVEAELYPSERTLVKIGDMVRVELNGTTPAEARVEFLNPEFRTNSQIVTMRASLPNEELTFAPGMHAQITFTHSAKNALAVPVDGVIRDGLGAHVYVQRGRNTFRPVEVSTGIENFDKVEIVKGLAEGDTVAVSGAYLLYSEFILKKGMHPIGH